MIKTRQIMKFVLF